MRIQAVRSFRTGTDVRIELVAGATANRGRGAGTAVGEMRVIEPPSRQARDPLTLRVSTGMAKDCQADAIRRAAGAVAKWLIDHKVRRASIDLSQLDALKVVGAIGALCEGLVLGAFRFDQHKTGQARATRVTIDLLASGQRGVSAEIQRAVSIAEAVNLARAWGHEPPNIINPLTLAQRLVKMAKKSGLSCRVLDDKQLARMKAGAILSVGVASKTPARMIVLEYRPTGVKRGTKPVVLVGKAVTFDTGGYSLKDKNGIVGMKYDKCGGMTVAGVMQAVAALKLKIPVVGIIAAAENMISGEAYRPNDIITTLSGKTVEIISTDAEGRLVLADAITYAQQKYQPRAMIDLATLTGGVVVALGSVRAGLFANNDALAKRLTQAGEHTHERLWRLPLDDEYLELIKGDDSDLKNSAGRTAHPVIGGMFIKQFVDAKTPWAHLDIAGVATCEKDEAYCPKGATGFGVRLLMNYLEGLR